MANTHYIYLSADRKPDAQLLTQSLMDKGYQATMGYLDYSGGQWSVAVTVELAHANMAPAIENNIISIANEFNAEYDGSETQV